MTQEKLPRPYAWFTHQADTARFTAEGEHCQHRRCRAPIEVVSHRWFRSGGQVLLAEHFWCDPHGREFAARWRVEIEPVSERSARYLSPAEAAARTAGAQECERPGCHRAPACVFTESYTKYGKPGADEDLFCEEHGQSAARRWDIRIDPAPAGGEDR